MSKFKIPFITNIPVEKEREFDEKIKTEMFYEKERDEKIRNSFNNKNSALRKIADYLYEHLNIQISYKQISEELKIPQSTIRFHIGDLNFFRGFPITMIPIPKKAGFIQSVLENEEDYEKWDRKKMKTITSMSVVKSKAEKVTSSKRRKKQKIKVPVKNVERKQKS